jgi:predicted CxxxxCH...CXXCH cytochrome family protein
LAGVTAATDAKVGAHVKHLNAVIGSTVTCSECHTVPTSPAVSGTHRDGTVQVAFSTLAKTGGLAPTVSRDATSGALVCSNTYCHGASLSGGSNKTPRWNDTAYNVGCTTCHGYPPTTIRGGATHSTSTSCSGCHSHVNVTNNGFTPTGVALHINGSVEASGGSAHSVPNYNHQAGGTGSACTGCHTVGTATSAYPAATLGNAPDCRGCHKKAAPGVGCSSCHGDATGRPNGTAFPDKTGQHSRGAHNVACTVCHVLGTSAGTGATINHGPGNRGTNPNVVGPGFTTGIILSGGTKGTSPAASCNHNATLGGGCGNGEGTKSW